jgi:uncharacterized protein YfkK (UPF0435 family)
MSEISTEQIREMIKDVLRAYQAENNGMFSIISERQKNTNYGIEGINHRLDKLNGSVGAHDKRIGTLEKAELTHIYECPIREDVEKLKQGVNIKLGVKGVIIGALSIIALVATITVSTLKIVENFSEPETEQTAK